MPQSQPPPPQPDSPETARAWLEWAYESSHQAGCLCHGCIRARDLLANHLTGTPAAESGPPEGPVQGVLSLGGAPLVPPGSERQRRPPRRR